MATELPKYDVEARAKARIIEQFKASPNFILWVEAIARQSQELLDAQWSLIDGFDLQDATGWALDVIGKSVGLPRPLIDAGLFEYFGFDTAPGVLGWGTLGDPGEGGVWASVFSETAGFVLMEDEQYRLNIQAKIIRNQGEATDEEILEIVRLVFPVSGVSTIVQNGTAGYLLTIGRALTTIEEALIELEDLNGNGDQLIPRPIGVLATYAWP